ncbi:acyl-CoA synthetase FdrA [Aerococcaceae bacterium zg-B36]|uniref:acyl-CoA synthetase FdrA n=1 Tax=Aerococcaceae bacterium zg-252 TaxID=2796928 RepID=UPI001BD8F726|nr:acyl-CoA synthetase FdrA [Aerococcaceae bacterium zg-B36]
MLLTKIQKGNYQDSINLMLLSAELNGVEGVIQAQVMMATDANKDIFKGAGLYTDELAAAGPNDMAVVVETNDESVLEIVLTKIDQFLNDLSSKKAIDQQVSVDNWEDALTALPDANMALVSIPGEYAAFEIENALDRGLHVFSFSDNIPIEDEVRLKEKAHQKGLLLMGPDCGTGVISSIPMAFTNVINPGNIGIVGASGTGIQEVTTIIDRLGGGVVHAIGTGGRDLKEPVGARTMMDAIIALEHHPLTDVICIISKPPAQAVRDEVVALLQSISKPVVAIFLGEKPTEHIGNIYFGYTLEETAKIAVDLANGSVIKDNYTEELSNQVNSTLEGKTVKGLYSGGTLANEAATLIADALDLGSIQNKEGYILNTQGFQVMDLGDDIYTQGKPHPMIDPSVRVAKLKEAFEDTTTGVILLDVVLGYGSHPDMANALAPTIKEYLEKARVANRELYIVGTVTGTNNDPQNYNKAVNDLKDAGVLVESTNAKAVRLALDLMGVQYRFADKKHTAFTGEKKELPTPSQKVLELLNSTPRVINIGLESFVEPIEKFGGKAIQYTWRPIAGGNKKLIRILNQLNEHAEAINEANETVIGRMKESQPYLVDVKYAKEVIPELNTDKKVVLHAGPPILFENMTGPMQGSVIGAMIFEGWAKDHEEARVQLEAGEVKFIPCHHVGAVGPMGGITTANFPVLVVENKIDGTTGYCIMNEGIGTVLRFGANNEEVINRLNWMRDVLGPVLGKALRTIDGGINVNVMIAKAIAMGDEFHQRNIAASLVFLKEISPIIVGLDIPAEEKQAVIQFLADTDQFFLNIAMATGKAIVDYARKFEKGTIVTTMARNGENFGIRIAEFGDRWFTAPVNTPKGLYFTGFSEEDGNKDIGDSAITETIGLGGSAIVAAPGVTRFIGAGGFQDAVRISNEQAKIVSSQNSAWTIPTWDFKGANLGIDIRKVVETGIEPIINTGIAHKNAGVGQVGAGTVTAPLACFEKALVAYAESLGIKVDD